MYYGSKYHQRNDKMKKFILGLTVGILISMSASVYGADIVTSIIGKQIQGEFPVKINGKALEKQAAVIDGTSYLPVRAMGDALNMDVSFDAELGIELRKRGGTSVPSTGTKPIINPSYDQLDPVSQKVRTLTNLQNKAKSMQEELSILLNPISKHNQDKVTNPDLPDDDAYILAKKTFEDKQAELAAVYQEIDVLIAEIKQLQNN